MSQEKSFHESWEQEKFKKVKETEEFPYPGTNRYPYDLVVTIVARRFFHVPTEERKSIRMLDLGCAGGNNAAFLAENGFDVYGIDGSPSAIEIAKERFAKLGLQGSFAVGDFLSLPYENDFFDFVLDRESLYANRREHVKRAIQEVWRVVKPGGILLSFSYSSDHPDLEYGKQIEPLTYADFKQGVFEGRGVAHFLDVKEMEKLYGGLFAMENIMKHDLREVYNKENRITEVAEYVIVAKKK